MSFDWSLAKPFKNIYLNNDLEQKGTALLSSFLDTFLEIPISLLLSKLFLNMGTLSTNEDDGCLAQLSCCWLNFAMENS